MAKAHFERTKPHVNIGTIGHVDHGTTRSITLPKKRLVVSQSTPDTLNMKLRRDTMLTLTAPVTPTTLRT